MQLPPPAVFNDKAKRTQYGIILATMATMTTMTTMTTMSTKATMTTKTAT